MPPTTVQQSQELLPSSQSSRTSFSSWNKLPCELQCQILGYVLQSQDGTIHEFGYWNVFNPVLGQLCMLNKEIAAVALHVAYTTNTFSFNIPIWGPHPRARCSFRHCPGEEVRPNFCSGPWAALWPRTPVCTRLRRLEIVMGADNMLDCSTLEELFQHNNRKPGSPMNDIASLLVPTRALSLENDEHVHWSKWQDELQHLRSLRIVIQEASYYPKPRQMRLSFHSLEGLDRFEELLKEVEIKLRATTVQVVLRPHFVRGDSDLVEELLNDTMEEPLSRFEVRLHRLLAGKIKAPEQI